MTVLSRFPIEERAAEDLGRLKKTHTQCVCEVEAASLGDNSAATMPTAPGWNAGPGFHGETPMVEGPDGPVPYSGGLPPGDPAEARRVASIVAALLPDLRNGPSTVAGWITTGTFPAAWVERAVQDASARPTAIFSAAFLLTMLRQWAAASPPGPPAVHVRFGRPAETPSVVRYPVHRAPPDAFRPKRRDRPAS